MRGISRALPLNLHVHLFPSAQSLDALNFFPPPPLRCQRLLTRAEQQQQLQQSNPQSYCRTHSSDPMGLWLASLFLGTASSSPRHPFPQCSCLQCTVFLPLPATHTSGEEKGGAAVNRYLQNNPRPT